MASFGNTSRTRLSTAHIDLQRLCNELIQLYDFTVLCGHRTEKQQDAAYAAKKSTKKWPNSKHNLTPALAVDIAPWAYNRILWGDNKAELLQIGRLIGAAEAVARKLGIAIRCGLDWDGDGQITDESFIDAFHIEVL